MDQFIHVWWPLLLPLIVVVAGGVVAGFFTIQNRRGGDKSKNKIPLPPTWPEMWARIDALEKKNEELEKRIDTLEDEKTALQRQTGAMLSHIRVLELQVPNPPGPPIRPNWTTEIAVLPGQ